MKINLTKKEYIRIYTKMLQIRRFEERAAQLYGMGHIGGFCHLYIGQEAVVVGVLMTIEKNIGHEKGDKIKNRGDISDYLLDNLNKHNLRHYIQKDKKHTLLEINYYKIKIILH